MEHKDGSDDVESAPSTSTRRSRHKDHKVHFGWIHFSKGTYKQVKCRQGGGTRTVNYSIAETQTVESLLSVGKALFFPEGRSQLGVLSEMEIHLSQFDGTEMSVFKDRNGQECSYQEFLKSNGLYASQHYLYIKTRQMEDKRRSESIPCSENAPEEEDHNENHPSQKSEIKSHETDTSLTNVTDMPHMIQSDRLILN